MEKNIPPEIQKTSAFGWKAKLLVWLGVVFIVGLSVFPHYLCTKVGSGGIWKQKRIGRHFLFASPKSEPGIQYSIDISRLQIEWVIVSAITIGAVFTFKDK